MTTKPSEAAYAAADRLDDQIRRDGYRKTLARVLQEHSDKARVVKIALMHHGKRSGDPDFDAIDSMILPDDPDPLEEAMTYILTATNLDPKCHTRMLRTQLAKRGLRIVEASDTPNSPQDAR